MARPRQLFLLCMRFTAGRVVTVQASLRDAVRFCRRSRRLNAGLLSDVPPGQVLVRIYIFLFEALALGIILHASDNL